MNDNAAGVSYAVIVCALLAFFVFNVRSCQQALDVEREKTRQQAIGAGLVEGEFGRFVKPCAIQAEAKP